MLYLHAFHVSTLNRYLHQKSSATKDGDVGPWACVTGASDGFGLGFSEELASRGFNVVLHGRNKDKLQRLRDRLQAQYPSRRFQILVIDASNQDSWSTAMANFVTDFERSNSRLTVLASNVGGGVRGCYLFEPMANRPPQSVRAFIDINAIFAAVFTHSLLPLLSRNQPSLILSLGSASSTFPPPYLGLYAGSKAFILAWSESLAREMELEGMDIEVKAIMLARVQSAVNRGRVFDRVTVPTGRVFARSALDKVGCGRLVVTPYWLHALQLLFIKIAPTWLISKMINAGTAEEMQWEQRKE